MTENAHLFLLNSWTFIGDFMRILLVLLPFWYSSYLFIYILISTTGTVREIGCIEVVFLDVFPPQEVMIWNPGILLSLKCGTWEVIYLFFCTFSEECRFFYFCFFLCTIYICLYICLSKISEKIIDILMKLKRLKYSKEQLIRFWSKSRFLKMYLFFRICTS